MSIWDDIRQSYVSDAVADRVKLKSQEKQQQVSETALYKKASLDPNYREIDKNNTVVLDGDTVYDKRTGEKVRVAGRDGTMLDTFETGVDRYGNPNYYYEKNPARFKAHAKAFARQAGFDIDEVTPQHLYEAGQGQKQTLIDQLDSMHGASYRIDGKDSYGTRAVGRFDDESNFKYISDLNAGYYSKFNSLQQAEDQIAGKDITDIRGDDRRWFNVAKDGIEGAIATLPKIPLDMAKIPFMMESASGGLPAAVKAVVPGAGALFQTAKVMDKAYNKLGEVVTGDTDKHILDALTDVTEYIDHKREGWKSEGQNWQDAKADIRRRVIQEPLYKQRVAAYEKEGHNAIMANTLAWIEGALDNVGYAVDNPATIATTSIESLPYFIGSAGVSRLATKSLAKEIGLVHTKIASGKLTQKELLGELRSLATLNKQMGKKGERAAVGFTALTEGASNGVASYDKVMKMDPKDLQDNPIFTQVIADGGSEKDAQRAVAGAAGAITFAVSGVVAGAANKLTGAAKIEAGLFRNVTKVTAKGKTYVQKLTKDASKQLEKIPGKTGKVVRGTTKTAGWTGKNTLRVADPALREGAEEIIQSGGGEAIAQEAAVILTGDESHRNPAASAEAAAAGLLSGAATGGTLGNISNAAKATQATLKAVQKTYSSKNIDKRHRATLKSENDVKVLTGKQGREKAQNVVENSDKPVEKATSELDTMAQDYLRTRKKGDDAPVVDIDQVEAFYEEYQKNGGFGKGKEAQAKHNRIEEFVKSVRRAAQQRNAEGAKRILYGDKSNPKKVLKPATPEIIAGNEELFRIVRDGVKSGRVKLPEGPEWESETGREMKRILSMDQEIAQALNELDEAGGARLAQEEGNIAANTRPTQVASAVAEARRVNVEKLGEGTKNRPGMRGWYRILTDIITDPNPKLTENQRTTRFNAMNSKLNYFMNTQEKRHERMTYLVKQFHKNGTVTRADEDKINEGEKHKIFWQAPREDGSGGTPALLTTARTELIKMREIQGKINEVALIKDPGNKKAVKAAVRGRVRATEAERKANIRLDDEEIAEINKKTVDGRYPKGGPNGELDGLEITRNDFLDRLQNQNTVQALEALIKAGYQRAISMDGNPAAWALEEVGIAQDKLDAILDARQKKFEAKEKEGGQKPTKTTAPKKAPEPKPKAKVEEPAEEESKPLTPLEEEVDDVGLLLSLLNIESNGSEPVTEEAVTKTLEAVRKALAEGFTVQNMKAIQKTLTWINTEGREFSDARLGRATKRVKDGRVAPEDANAHYGVQLAEEIVEVLVELTSNTKELQIQKAELKIIRFGPNTVIKDGANKGKTNQQVYDELVGNTEPEYQSDLHRFAAKNKGKEVTITFGKITFKAVVTGTVAEGATTRISNTETGEVTFEETLGELEFKTRKGKIVNAAPTQVEGLPGYIDVSNVVSTQGTRREVQKIKTVQQQEAERKAAVPPTVEEEFTPPPTVEEEELNEKVEENKDREGTEMDDHSVAPEGESGVAFLNRATEASQAGQDIEVPAAFAKTKQFLTKLRNMGFVLANKMANGNYLHIYAPTGGRATTKDETVPDVVPTTRVVAPQQAPEIPKAPADILEDIVNNTDGENGPGLSRESFGGNVDPEHFKHKVGIKWLFPKEGGMTVEQLLDFIQDGGYGLAEGVDRNSRPDRMMANDALEMLFEILDQERRVVSAANQEAEDAVIAANRAADEFDQQEQEDNPTFIEPDSTPAPEEVVYNYEDQEGDQPGDDVPPDFENEGNEEYFDERPTPQIEYSEEDIPDMQIAYHELGLHIEAVDENPNIDPKHIVFTGQGLREYWAALIRAWEEQNEDRAGLSPIPFDVKGELLRLKAMQEESFPPEGLETPKAEVEGEHTGDVLESAETLSDPTQQLDAQTLVEGEKKGTLIGFLAKLMSTTLIPSNYRSLNAAAGLWKLTKPVRLARGDAELKNARGNGMPPPQVLDWLKDFIAQRDDAKLPEADQQYSIETRFKMAKGWKQFDKDLKEALKLKKLPQAIRQFIGPKSPTTRNILNRIAPFFEVIADYGTRIQVFKAAKLSASEQTAMGGIGRFVASFTDSLVGVALGTLNEVEDNQPGRKNVPWYRHAAGVNAPGIIQPLREYGLQWLMGMDGSVDPNLAAVMALVGGEWAASTGTQTLWNEDDAINSKLGRPEGTEVTPEEKKIFQHGTLLSNVVQDMGYRVIRQMNLTSLANQDMDPVFMERLAISIGLMTLATMEQQNILQIYQIPRELFLEHQGNENFLDSGGDFSLVRLKLDTTVNDQGYEQETENQNSKVVRMYFGMATGALKKLFDLETVEKGPHFEVPEVPTRVDTGHTKLPAKMIKALTAASSRVWQPIQAGFDVMTQFDEENFKTMMGWKSPESIAELHKEERTAQESKNSTIEREIEYARDWYATAGKTPFHFAYKIISSGRIYINSTSVNPQASKIHRFLFAQKTWTMEMPIGAEIKDSKRAIKIQLLKVAVAQGMGIKVDEQSLEQSVKDIDEMLDRDIFKKALRALKKKNLTAEDQAIVTEAVLLGGEGMHSLLALRTWADYTKARNAKSRGGKPHMLKVTLPIEIDGKTNGFAIGMLQTPVGASLVSMLQATGLYTKADNIRSYIDFDGDDNYEDMANGTNQSFDKNIRDGELNKEQRQAYIERFNLWQDETEKKAYSTAGPKYKPIDGGWPVAEGFWWKLNGADLLNLRNMLNAGQLLTDPNSEAEKAQRIKYVDYLLAQRTESSSRFRMATLGSFLKINRNFAKNPLMISAYGASMAALRRALGNNAIKAIYEALSDQAHFATRTNEEGEIEFLDPEMARHQYATILTKIDVMMGVGTNVEYDSLDAEQAFFEKSIRDYTAQLSEESDYTVNEWRKNYNLKTKVEGTNLTREEAYKLGIDDTYGRALEDAVKAKIGAFEKIREQLNQAVSLMNLLFEEDFTRRIDQWQEAKGRIATDPVRKRILNKMIKEGAVPLIKSPLSKNELDSIEVDNFGRILLKNDSENEDDHEKGRAYFNYPRTQQQINSEGQVLPKVDASGNEVETLSLVSLLQVMAPNQDIGIAALVKMIHSSDGATMAQLLTDFEVLGIHDAIMGNPLDILEAGVAANKSFFETQRDWNLGQEIYTSLHRMLPILAREDSRLTHNQKLKVVTNFSKALERGKYSENQDITKWVTELAKAVRNNNRNRAELFNNVTVSHQFAFPTTEYVVPENQPEILPEEVPNVISLRHMIMQAVEAQAGHWAEMTRVIAEQLRIQNASPESEAGNPIKTLAKFINIEHPPAEIVLDLMWQAFVNVDGSPMSEEAQERFRAVMNMIRPALSKGSNGKPVQVVLRVDGGMTKPAMYDPDTNTIYLSDSIDQLPSAFLHEAIHAANWSRLKALKAQDAARKPGDQSPKVFEPLLKAAKDWARTKDKHSIKGANRMLAAQIEVLTASDQDIDIDELIEALGYKDTTYAKTLTELYAQGKEFADGDVRAVAEYTAWLNANIRGNGTLAWEGAQAIEAFQTLAASLVNKNGNNIFYSGPRGVVHDAFTDEGQEVTATSFQKIIDDLGLLDNVDPEVKAHYQDLIAILTPGLESIDRIVLKMRDNPTEAASGGALLVTPTHLEIQLESAGNRLSNPNMMTRQEAMLHEIIHAMFLTAIEKDTKTQTLLEDFYERVKTHVEANGGWRVFAPSNPSPEERVLAEERYEYLFGISLGPNGEARDASRHLHEFAAIGLTDPFFADVLRGMKPEKPGSPWEKGFLQGLMSIFVRVINWISGAMDGSNKNMYEAMTKLTGHVIGYNTKNLKISDQDMQYLRLQKTLDAIDDTAVNLFLKLKNQKIRAWAMANGLSKAELDKALEEENSKFGTLVTLAKSAAGNGLQANMEGFRAALEDSASGLEKDHWLFELLTEIMPWAETNHNWIDMLRESEVKIDMQRQQLIEHNRTAIQKFFAIGTVQKRFTDRQREAISHVMYFTDLSALKTGRNPMSDRGILNLLGDQTQVDSYISALETKLAGYGTPELRNLWSLHADGMARLMVNSVSEGVALQTQNVHQMVEQYFTQDPGERVYIDPTTKEEIKDILEHLITLKALNEVPAEIKELVHPIMVRQMDRTDGLENGFEALLGMHLSYKQASLVNNFDGNPTNMWKGYVKEIYDQDIDIQVRPNRAFDEREMKSQGYRKETVLPRDPDGPDLEMVIWTNSRGISTYSKAFFSLTDTDSRGTGYFDMFFANDGSNDPQATAARVHRERAKHLARTTRQVRSQARSGNTLRPGTRMVPVFHPDTGQVVDYRYVMTRETKKKLLKRRDFHDEVLPGMIAAATDKETTKTINREGVEMLAEEHRKFRLDDSIRFIQIGKDFDGLAGEMWALLPEDTKMAAREEFGGDFMYVRDDIVNLVFGFRKLTISNLKFLGPAAPVVRMAERIWQEIIQWERFRIAVLNPAVVVGNIVSNIVILLIQGIPPRYILRHYKDAIRGMRKFQKQTRMRNELTAELNSKQARGVNTDELEGKLARLEYYLQSNPVKPLIDEGLFTNIVEEFGVDEKSYRRKISNRLLDAAGGITGSQGLVRASQELWMTPGSNTASFALAATQYGDFVARYLQYSWDMRGVDVKTKEGQARKADAVRSALSNFIFYNIPQNKYLQWLNDNGFMMFTKFFFRIQPIIARLFAANPVRASALFLAQQNADIQVMGDSISNYAFMSGLPNKLNLTVWDHVTDGHLLKPNLVNWFSWLYDE